LIIKEKREERTTFGGEKKQK